MAIGSLEEDRVVRSDLVQILAGRKDGRFPEGLDPAAAGDPAARVRLRDLFLDPGEKKLAAGRALQVQVAQPFADAEEVVMRIR